MALDLVDYEQKARDAVKAFWGNREAARQKQIESGKADQGERAGVTGGKNMDGFLALVLDVIKANGLAHAEIHQNRAMLTLPGYFRPTKLWDLLVIYKGELIAAIELKSHVGPSFSNNFNNRTEEACVFRPIVTAHSEKGVTGDSEVVTGDSDLIVTDLGRRRNHRSRCRNRRSRSDRNGLCGQRGNHPCHGYPRALCAERRDAGGADCHAQHQGAVTAQVRLRALA